MTDIQQVREALEGLAVDANCINCPVISGIAQIIRSLNGKVIVDVGKLRQRIKSDLCGEYGRSNYRYRGHITEAEIDAEIHKLTKEDSDE